MYPVIKHTGDTWKGFGIADASMLYEAYSNRIKMTEEDIELGLSLWHAYSCKDFTMLLRLAGTYSKAFSYLPEVCRAHAERFPADQSLGRPERMIRDLIAQIPNDFTTVFAAFSQSEGIYGFGDAQVKRMYDKVNLPGGHQLN